MKKKKVIEEVKEYVFNPLRDIAAVEQFGSVDLVKANLTSSVPASIESEDSKFNGIEDPAAIAGRPRDIFEHAQASKVIAGYKAPTADDVPPAE